MYFLYADVVSSDLVCAGWDRQGDGHRGGAIQNRKTGSGP